MAPWHYVESTHLPPNQCGRGPGVDAICGLSLLLVLSQQQQQQQQQQFIQLSNNLSLRYPQLAELF